MILGAQSYTVRQYMQNDRDFDRSMGLISDIGYRAVQLSGVGAISPKRLREICDSHGLEIALTHTPSDRIASDIDSVIKEHEILGCRYVGIGSMPERYRSEEWIDCFAEDYLPSAEALRKAGMKLMYHNHNFEWERLSGGETMLDRLLSVMPSELMGVTLDMYWVQAAGADVLATIDRLKGRLDCVHLKDMAVKGFEQRMAAIGAGNMDYHSIVERLNSQGGTEYAFVEQDTCYGASPFDCLKYSFDYLTGEGLFL